MKFLWALLLTFSFSTLASVEISNVEFIKKGKTGQVVISYKGNLVDYPELRVNNKSVHIDIPNSSVKRTINKSVNFVSKSRLTKLSAIQQKNGLSKVKTIVPFNIQKYRNKVNLTIKDSHIILSIPAVAPEKVSRKAPPARKMVNTSKRKVPKSLSKAEKEARDGIRNTKNLLNEDYLKQLESKKTKAIIKPKVSDNSTKDMVTTTLAAPKKSMLGKSKSSFSIVEYAGKFVAFLGVVLLLFYGVIQLMKKGVIKKGKLGFLNNTQQVSVLSQTYIAPKKSLMLIQAHNQVFLVSNTDSGIHPISEIDDVAGLLKTGEKIIAGNNFDDSLGTANEVTEDETKVKMKENIMESNKASSLSDFVGVKDKVKFSDQIKKKVKGLKPLQ